MNRRENRVPCGIPNSCQPMPEEGARPPKSITNARLLKSIKAFSDSAGIWGRISAPVSQCRRAQSNLDACLSWRNRRSRQVVGRRFRDCGLRDVLQIMQRLYRLSNHRPMVLYLYGVPSRCKVKDYTVYKALSVIPLEEARAKHTSF